MILQSRNRKFILTQDEKIYIYKMLEPFNLHEIWDSDEIDRDDATEIGTQISMMVNHNLVRETPQGLPKYIAGYQTIPRNFMPLSDKTIKRLNQLSDFMIKSSGLVCS